MDESKMSERGPETVETLAAEEKAGEIPPENANLTNAAYEAMAFSFAVEGNPAKPENSAEEITDANGEKTVANFAEPNSVETPSEAQTSQSAKTHKIQVRLADVQKTGGNGKKKRKNFLVTYAVSMLAIALGLLFLSYLSQNRAQRDQISDLEADYSNYSVSAMQSIEGLKQENQDLKAEIEGLTEWYEAKFDSMMDTLLEREAEYKYLERDMAQLGAELSALTEERFLMQVMEEVVALVRTGERDNLGQATMGAVTNHFKIAKLSIVEKDFYQNEYLSALETLRRRGWITLEKDENGVITNLALTD